ncbi:MAG: hypothetical protein AAFZ52_10865 [Bacteroidota bacterium]
MSLALGAQPRFAPAGAEWCLRGYDGANETVGYVKVRYERDTTVRGVATKILSVRGKALTGSGLVDSYYSPVELFQQEADSVFYFIPAIQDREYMFKTGYVAGEVTTSFLYNEPFNVVDVAEETFAEQTLTVAKMKLPEWLERNLPVTMYGPLGPDRGFIQNWSTFLDGEGGLDLEAFRADDWSEIKIRARSQCFALLDNVLQRRIVRSWEKPDVGVYAFPNPVTSAENWLIIRPGGEEFLPDTYLLRLFDAAGREVGARRFLRGLPNSFPVTDLPAGRFYGEVTAGEQRFTFSFVKTP